MELLMFLVALGFGLLLTFLNFKYSVFGVFAIVFSLSVVGFLVSSGLSHEIGYNLGQPVLMSYDANLPLLMVSFLIILNVLVLLHKLRV